MSLPACRIRTTRVPVMGAIADRLGRCEKGGQEGDTLRQGRNDMI